MQCDWIGDDETDSPLRPRPSQGRVTVESGPGGGGDGDVLGPIRSTKSRNPDEIRAQEYRDDPQDARDKDRETKDAVVKAVQW